MQVRCPTAEPLFAGYIEGYALAFKGDACSAVATIEPRDGSRVPVLVWEPQAEDWRALDRYEGYPHLYGLERMAVRHDGVESSVNAYIMDERFRYGLPSEYYFDTIAQGYEDNGLDVKHLYDALAVTQLRMGEQLGRDEQMSLEWR